MTPLNRAAPVPPEWYWKPEWLEREKEAVFATNWYFAGFTQDLAKPNDYISLTVAGVPVIVRNMKDRLVAFRNICSHRHSLIHPRGCGSAMFRCPYHGWTYDDAGVPIGIPDNAKSFGFDKEAKCTLALDPVQVDTCGRFVFVRLAAQGPSLKHWLGTLAEKLEHISTLFSEIYGRKESVWKCNWKLAMEITLEDYHHPYVHPSTYYHHLGREAPSEAMAPVDISEESMQDEINTFVPGNTEYIGPHSHGHAALAENTRQFLDKVAKRLKLPRSSKIRGYHHFLIFPNMVISVDDGVNSYVGRYEPLSEQETRSDGWVMTGMPQDVKLHNGLIWQTMTKQWQDYTFSIVDEDRGACEIIQPVIPYAHKKAILGNEEDRIRQFQAAVYDQVTHQKKAA